jgi:HEPN domain-containing protein
LSAELLIASHLRLADQSLKAAQLLLREGNRNAVYHAQQAVEMIVLALAQSESIHYGRSQQHQLDTMVRSLSSDNAFKSELSELSWLEAYATTFRYPRTKGGITDPPPAEKLNGALTKTADILNRAADHFGVDISISASSPAAHSRPPRTTREHGASH